MKYKIEVASNIRGFLKVLFESEFRNSEFINNKPGIEISGTKGNLLRKIFESKIFDMLGLIQILRHNTAYDAQITYNRYMKSNRPYYVICENPTALYHYRLSRKNGLIARFLLRSKYYEDRLKAIVCISEACSSTFCKIHGVNKDKVHQIYPLIKDTGYVRGLNLTTLINCLFVSSTFELKSGCEIVCAAKSLPNVNFVLITRKKEIPLDYLKTIDELSNIELVEFKLSKEALAEYYKKADVLLHVTRQDSSPLVVLEAIKYGLPVLATNVYAIPEMVIDGYNGYLTEPRYLFFGHDNMPNPEVWNHREETIYSHYTDERIIRFLIEKIQYFDKHRDILYEFSQNSLLLSTEKFGEKKIRDQWEGLIESTINM